MVISKNNSEAQWYRVDLVATLSKNTVARFGFIAISDSSEHALKDAMADIERFGSGTGIIMDPGDPDHTVYPLCEEDALQAWQSSAAWPKSMTVSLAEVVNIFSIPE